MHSPVVLIVKSDRLHADLLQQVASSIIPNARCEVVGLAKTAEEKLRSTPVDLLLTGIDSLDGDVLELLDRCYREGRAPRATLVVTARREQRILDTLRALPINGVFDTTTEDRAQLGAAVSLAYANKNYWSKSLLQISPSVRPISRLLTHSQQRVFAVIGDGSDDNTAAAYLGLRPSTVASIRKDIHRKLRVHHRGELVRLAVVSGYVCFAAGAVIRPGLSLLTVSRQSNALTKPRRKR